MKRTLVQEGFRAFIPTEEKKSAHFDIHVSVSSVEQAREVANRLVRLYGLKLKKRHDNGTHLLYLPNLVAVVVAHGRQVK